LERTPHDALPPLRRALLVSRFWLFGFSWGGDTVTEIGLAQIGLIVYVCWLAYRLDKRITQLEKQAGEETS
jgi:hypothetical protein